MILYEMRTIPSRDEKYIAGVRCDLCGRTAKGAWRQWTRGSFDVNEVEISFRDGSQYPEGGSGTKTEFDICPTCFKEKLVPWFTTQGAQPRVENWDA